VPLTNISIKHLRCFDRVEISLSPGINFFHGPNGSGKTSLLEALFIFSSGKSFKSSNLQSLIKYDKKNFYLKGYDGSSGHIIEVEKHINKPVSLKLNNQKIVSSKLIKKFPCTPIHNNTFSFTIAPPDFRRKMLDRSIFIAEENFSSIWFAYHRTLKQRNVMLKNNLKSDIYVWDKKLAVDGELITEYRKNFFDKVLIEFKNLLNILEPNSSFDFFDLISIDFFCGWNSNDSLLYKFEENLQYDLKRKTTTEGPHKSDIKFFIKNIDARQILSRGEQKFFSILWSFAQNEVLKKHYKIEATLIIDDLKSELDERVFDLFVELLKHNENQVIFSCIEDCFSSKISNEFNEFKKFHVEQLG
tara:strand:- start:116 stop:1192 length:1077 start_codon:yes stop_codon:yes gene_type:complete